MGSELIALSLVSMVSILIPLVIIVCKTSQIQSGSSGGYWSLKFPFEIHAAWIMAATLVNINVLLVAYDVTLSILVSAAWASLSVLTIVAVYYTFKQKWVVPAVLAWASYGIRSELSAPNESIVNSFSAETISSIGGAAGILAGAILLVAILSALYRRVFVKEEVPQNEASEPTLYTSLAEDH